MKSPTAVGADLFKIEQKVPYAADYNTCIEQVKNDLRAKARPELVSVCRKVWITMMKFIWAILSTVLQDYLCKVSQIPMELYHEDTLIISKCLLTKSKDWEYEKEWRLFSRAYNEQYKPYRIPIQLRPKALFMGVKMDKEKELELYSICKEKNIKCYKMLQDFQGKEFTVSAVPYEQIITWGEMKKLGIV